MADYQIKAKEAEKEVNRLTAKMIDYEHRQEKAEKQANKYKKLLEETRSFNKALIADLSSDGYVQKLLNLPNDERNAILGKIKNLLTTKKQLKNKNEYKVIEYALIRKILASGMTREETKQRLVEKAKTAEELSNNIIMFLDLLVVKKKRA